MQEVIDIAVQKMLMNEAAADNARFLQSVGITEKFVEWIEAHNAKVARRERERLIELFQADKFLYEMEIDHVISIIKGEEQ